MMKIPQIALVLNFPCENCSNLADAMKLTPLQQPDESDENMIE